MQGIIKKQISILKNGRTIRIGTCAVSQKGVGFETKGLIFSKNHFVPWNKVEFEFGNRQLVVIDSHESRKRTTLSLREVDNAATLQFLKKEMTK